MVLPAAVGDMAQAVESSAVARVKGIRKRSSIRRVMASPLWAAAGCLALAPLSGFDLQDAERIRCLKECRPAINLVMIGSSVVREHFIPRVFDAEMGRRGHRVRSLNLGVEGMNIYEQEVVL